MLTNKNQAIVSGLLGLGIVGFATATALPFNDRIEYRIGNRIESQPAWLVPPKAEFRAIERGYGGIKILLALLATGGMVATMLIARKKENRSQFGNESSSIKIELSSSGLLLKVPIR